MLHQGSGQADTSGTCHNFVSREQVYPRSGSFRDMSAEIEVELSAFSITVLSTAPGSDDSLALSEV